MKIEGHGQAKILSQQEIELSSSGKVQPWQPWQCQTYQSKKGIKAEVEVDFYARRCRMDRNAIATPS
ncbi:hypothetical protein QUA54_27600 [Microcoleus sp. MOSTC5]|uniref:hypothetical protein n=1 Tax=Microcoleus sp. MOSTC5 TaxID=3055378 RepID=UPI002FD0682C